MTSLTLALLLALQKDPSSTKEAMRPVQLLVGEWKAQVQPDGADEAWEETQKWEYRIEKDAYSLTLAVTDGRLFKGGQLGYDLKRKVYRYEVEGADGKRAAFEGRLSGKELPLEEVLAAEGPQRRVVFNLLRDNRILMAVERRDAPKKPWVSTHALAATKQGVPFVRAQGPKCVVTGGSPDAEISYKGKTYYVCCSTCRKEFNADPEKHLAAARKEGWIKD